MHISPLPSRQAPANVRARAVKAYPTRSIMMVDDEQSYTDLMSQMLEVNLGCPVHAFTRPLEALQRLRDVRPAVVITDYFMPQLTGIDFIRQGNALLPATAFVLISGHNLCETEGELAELSGLKGVLSKPFGWRQLADEVVRVWPGEIPAPAIRAADGI